MPPAAAQSASHSPEEKALSLPGQLLDLARELLWTQRFWDPLAALVLAGDAVLCLLIIRRVAYTEIDWTTYMQQVELFIRGQYDYSKIKGDTGPLVYPAGHVYIYSLLHYITSNGKDIRLAQYMFAGVYLTSLALVMAILKRCRTIPPLALFFLPLSKRLHSIYMLRLFNDGIAVTVMYACILACIHRRWRLSAVLYSLALSVKMNILLYFPAYLLLSHLDTGFNKTVRNVTIIALLQIVLASPFLLSNAQAYFASAFDFRRQFLFKWTVNWRFAGEAVFQSRTLSVALLLLHIGLLLVFLRKWLEPHGGHFKVARRSLTGLNYPGALSKNALTADYFAHVFFTANLIGIICARSLHYQFYSWYAFQTVYLAWRSPFPFVIRLGILAATEYCWNVYPSTNTSSALLLLTNLLLLCGSCLTRTRELQVLIKKNTA